MQSDQVRAVCPECIRLLACDSEEDADAKITSHNESMHNGEDVGFVIRETVEEMAKFLNEVYDRVNEEEYRKFRRQLGKGTAEVYLSAKEFKDVDAELDHDTKQYKY